MLLEEEKLNIIDFIVWFNLNSFSLYQAIGAIGVRPKKDKTKRMFTMMMMS